MNLMNYFMRFISGYQSSINALQMLHYKQTAKLLLKFSLYFTNNYIRRLYTLGCALPKPQNLGTNYEIWKNLRSRTQSQHFLAAWEIPARKIPREILARPGNAGSEYEIGKLLDCQCSSFVCFCLMV